MSHIEVFSAEQLGLNFVEYRDLIRKEYDNYEYDNYLLRQEKIKFLNKKGFLDYQKHFQELIDFYTGKLEGDIFLKTLKVSDAEIKDFFDKFTPYRKRLISEYIVKDGNIRKISSQAFSQEKALIDEKKFDFRSFPRKFKEAPDNLDTYFIRTIITYLYDKLFEIETFKELKVIVHYTIVKCIEKNGLLTSSNSPEGIHQDGMDYIISALVLDRKNINGGISKIYLGENRREILNIILQEGYGLFHKDKDTDIWHEVTPINRKNEDDSPSFRSTVGFDVEIIK